MRIGNISNEKSCTFCGNSQQIAHRLIESPDHRKYICDQCVVEPGRLKLAPEGHENRQDSFSPSTSKLGRFFQEYFQPKQLRCSFCEKKIYSRDAHVSATHQVTQVQICSSCLVVCGQILSDVAQRKYPDAR
jgi:hypothetical protein